MKQTYTVIIGSRQAVGPLCRLLGQTFPEIAIAAMAETVPDAVAAIRTLRPKLVFMDVTLKDGTGFEVLAQLPDRDAEVIFLTGSGDFAMEAYRHHAVGYLLLPLEEALVIRTVRRCLDRMGSLPDDQVNALLQQFLQTSVQTEAIGVPTVEGIEFLNSGNILYAEAKGNYTGIRLNDGATVVTSKRLCEIEERLPAYRFIRVHHSFIVNTHYIKKYYKGRGGYLLLQNEVSIPVSVRRKDEFLKRFE